MVIFSRSGNAISTLHIHLDEAGDWTFGAKGSKYFIIAAAWTTDPAPLGNALTELRYSLTRQGHDTDGFHAAPDEQAVRDAVVAALLAHQDWHFGAVVVEKRKVNPALYDPTRFFPQFAGYLLRFILRGRAGQQANNVLVYADTLPLDTRKKREGALKAIKTACSAHLPKGCTHHSYSHCHQSNAWIQVVDYCAWGIQRKWERGDPRTYNQLRPRMAREELNITDRGDGRNYY